MPIDFLELYRGEKALARCRVKKGDDSHDLDRDQSATTAEIKVLDNSFSEQPINFPPIPSSIAFPRVALTDFRVGKIPEVFYIPNFVCDNIAEAFLNQIYAVPSSHKRWTTLKTRRLQCWGGKLEQNCEGHDSSDLSLWLSKVCEELVDCGIFPSSAPPNHVLINEYQPGQGIMPHTDGPLYFPRTATLSLQSDAVIHFSRRPKSSAEIGLNELRTRESIFLQSRSLLVFTCSAYTDYLHGIDFCTEDLVDTVVNNDLGGSSIDGGTIKRNIRNSLTFRHVLKT